LRICILLFFVLLFLCPLSHLLGQLYCKRHLWGAAEGELKQARDILEDNAEFISCNSCKLTLEISFHVQARDLSWNLFEKDVPKHSTCNLSNALGMYQSAMEKLNDICLEFSPGSSGKLNV
jgi:hypothetical protein